MIFIDSKDYDINILNVFNEHIPILSVHVINKDKNENEASPFSKWFRNVMGSAFGFIDVDYLIYNPNTNKLTVIEEKTDISALKNLTLGQKISYQELIVDFLDQNINTVLYLVLTDMLDTTKNINYSNWILNNCNQLETTSFQDVNISDFLEII